MALLEASVMRVLKPVPSPIAVSLRVVSTNAPFGAGVVSTIVADVTALSNAAVQIGMLSPLSARVPGFEMLLMLQSTAFHAVARQTGSENVTVMRLAEMAIAVKTGLVVST